MTENKKRMYFAHPINTYNTIIEKFFLEKYSENYEIINPNQEIHQIGVKKEGMDYFKPIVQSCDMLFAFGFGDNSVGAGIAKEMNWMKEKGGIVIFLPFFTKYEEMFGKAEDNYNVLSVDDTRKKLKSYDEV
jgi:hypothetical protein